MPHDSLPRSSGDITKQATACLEDRVRDAIKGVLEQVMEEAMTVQFQAKHRERTERRLGERNGHYGRALTTAAGHIEQIRVPRARDGIPHRSLREVTAPPVDRRRT
jgi:transposase-like protein